MGAKYSCQIVAGLLAAHGVRHVVMSPGSRNAPLIMAVDSHPELKAHMVIDERSASFMALGMAQVSRKPVAVVCTSGTALLNYAPAVAEAYYQHIPLIVVSADRPAQWIDQDDSQTLRQPGALANIVKFSCNLPDFDDPEGELAWYAQRQVNDAMLSACAQAQGPVHINVQLAEPLTKDYPPLPKLNKILELRGVQSLAYSDVQDLAHLIRNLRIMVVAGFMPPSEIMTRAISKLAAMPNVVVLAESMANLHCDKAFNSVDRILTLVDDNDERFRPQLVISVGGALVSRHLKTYLRNCEPFQHWSVGVTDTSADVFKHLVARINVLPERFMLSLADALAHEEIENDFAATWQSLLGEDTLRHELLVARAPWSSLKAFAMLWPQIPPRTNVQLSNGTCVRYAQLFYNPKIHACYCNRGVSGIDGCTSTAVGASLLYDDTTLLITGDMSYAYDLSGLLNACTSYLKIIVINNKGGGIFRFIPSTRGLHNREACFCVPPGIKIPDVALLHRFEVFFAYDERSMREVLPSFFECKERAVLEITVDPGLDADTITNYFSK